MVRPRPKGAAEQEAGLMESIRSRRDSMVRVLLEEPLVSEATLRMSMHLLHCAIQLQSGLDFFFILVHLYYTRHFVEDRSEADHAT